MKARGRRAPEPGSATGAPGRSELRLARTALLAVGAVAVPLVAGAGYAHGAAGVRGALAGLALVLVLFGVAALLQALVARAAPSTFVAVVAAGIGLRLAAYLAGLQWLTGMPGLHTTTLAVATVSGIAVTLVAEMVTIARTPQFFWVQTAPRQGAPTT